MTGLRTHRSDIVTTRREVLRLGSMATMTALAGCTMPTGDDAGTRLESTDYLTFEDTVDDDLRVRTRHVYERVVDIVGREVSEQTTVSHVESDEVDVGEPAGLYSGTRTQRLAVQALDTVDEGDNSDFVSDRANRTTPARANGLYDPQTRTIYFYGGDSDDISDQLIAHELCHAIQYQTTDIRELDLDVGFDRYHAYECIVEGTATHLETSYVDGCESDFPMCQLRDLFPIRVWYRDHGGTGTVIAVLADGAYNNGHDFAAALADRGGWEAIWDAHQDPPDHTGQVLRSEWYPDRDPVDVTVADPGTDDWTRLGSERLGMQSVFATLWLSGALPWEAIAVGDLPDETRVQPQHIRYRSEVTDAWSGDEFAAFERDDDREGWLWRIRWTDAAAAEDGYEAFRAWADERGQATDEDGVWKREESYEAVVLEDEDVLIGSAPDRDALESLSPALVE